MEESSPGLVVYRASRLEALLDPLAQLLEAQRPASPLAPQTIVAAHPGMKHWLVGALARRRGAGGIVANLDIVLPSSWLDTLAQQVLGEHAVSLLPYRREHLRWRIHELLDSLDAPEVRAYLQGDDLARRRFQLADRLARLYSQYLVYRPDWLVAWARGNPPPRDPGLDGGFMAALWRRMRWQIGIAHRGEMVARMTSMLAHGARVPDADEPLHVFGVSHLAPTELELLRAVSRQRTLILYVPDPCRERWAGLSSDRRLLREKIRTDAFSPETESLFLEQEHPLLAQWGRMGQHFMLALEDSETDIVQDVRHWLDEAGHEHEVDAIDGDPDTRLHRVQHSIRRLEPALLAPIGDAAAQRADASLRVHLCHTRLRELEVLRDCLLRHMRDLPGLRPSDIVVMAPDIKAYLPLLPSVFGPPGYYEGPLPYHLADVAVARSHPLFEAFRRLLDLPRSRVTAPEVIDLLSMPEVARRFGLAGGDIDALTQWLRNGRVAWALDPAFREGLGLPPIAEHTFAWGVDRMLAGYLIGEADDGAFNHVVLPDGCELAPLDGVHGPQAAALGALDGLLCELADAHADRGRTLRASHWALRLEARLESLFRVDPDDHLARDAKSMLLQFVREIATEPAQSGLDPELEFDVVREMLLERLDAAPERQQFLMGGATFCGMVPQRSIPFRVIAVIGLNEGEFPRGGGESGLDPMQRHRRPGDRDVRNDDRYLFLETLMSARDALHLSFIGEGVRDGKPRNPSAPLGELMATLERVAGLALDDDEPDAPGEWRRPWLVRHPLQPFDARYFDGVDPALFSFRNDFARMIVPPDAGGAPAPFYAPAASRPAQAAPTEPLALRDVLAYFRDPARHVLADGLRLRLDALDDRRLRDCEPLEARFESIDGVGRRLFVDAVARGTAAALPDTAPAWLRLGGQLPPGRLGQQAWETEKTNVEALLERCGEYTLFADGAPERMPVDIDLAAGPFRVRGELARSWRSGDASWVFDAFPGRLEAQLDFRPRIGLFIEWALLRLHETDDRHAVRLCALTTGDKRPWEQSINRWDEAFVGTARAGDAAGCASRRADLAGRVGSLLEFSMHAQMQPSWYFPKTSWAAAHDRSPIEVWRGGPKHKGERDYEPGYARLLAGEREFEPESAEYADLCRIARKLRALIDFDMASSPDEATA